MCIATVVRGSSLCFYFKSKSFTPEELREFIKLLAPDMIVTEYIDYTYLSPDGNDNHNTRGILVSFEHQNSAQIFMAKFDQNKNFLRPKWTLCMAKSHRSNKIFIELCNIVRLMTQFSAQLQEYIHNRLKLPLQPGKCGHLEQAALLYDRAKICKMNNNTGDLTHRKKFNEACLINSRLLFELIHSLISSTSSFESSTLSSARSFATRLPAQSPNDIDENCRTI
ncbi:unnamed protein product [Didymodactylos carnosus]|uniref:Uncharacterized protein n=1 Tax=Didymodactylos carnosus TaxID=1234261 RepID=A0A814NQP8_9BILA|nr:unnamed protein product [Didymodactylos carnosus]CAF1330252.1 unnamed protein product [Didymodactylos carnosus]CAF3860974.1 unnamed protein product [Didymodactylos carnosus]CAF4141655.1 unnamed protein product [Didymodactylos carnosus]